MVKQDIINYVTNAEQVIDSLQNALRKSASEKAELESQLKLSKEASAPMQFDDAALRKVANDIHTLYGKPSNVSPDQIIEHWKANPNAIVGSLQKMATAQLASVASGNHLGAPADHEVEEEKVTTLDADDVFKGKYSNR